MRKYLALPVSETIAKYIGPFDTIGSHEEAIKTTKLFFSDKQIIPYCTLMFDEIYLKPSLRYRGGHLIGYSTDEPNKLAKTALVFMTRVIFKSQPNSFLLRIIPVFKLTANVLFESVLSCLRLLHEAGGIVISLICDNLSTNRKLYKLLKDHFCLITHTKSQILSFPRDHLFT